MSNTWPRTRPWDVRAAVSQAEDALANLSNAIADAFAEMAPRRYRGNAEWADAAVDRALRDLAQIRAWLDKPARRKGD